MLKRLSMLSMAVASVVAQQCHTGVVVGNLNITDGTPLTAFIAQTGGTAKGGVTIANGNSVTVQHNYRAYVAEQCLDSFQPSIFRKIPLLGRTLTYTVDLSQVGCACNAALYLTYMPAYDSNQQPDPTKCGDYYCDANNVCGVWCPEIDIMEANQFAYQATPHKCDTPTGKYYPHCDGGGCGRNTYKLNPTAYGPGSQYTIDTRSPFEVSVSFNADSSNALASITTELRQKGRTFRIVHDGSCGNGYLPALSDALKDGMVITVSYWGDKSSTMSWLDIPPCAGDVDCNVATSFTFSNLVITSNN